MGNAKSSTNTKVNMSETINFINQENAKHDVVIWSKSYCQYCAQTKRLVASLDHVDYKVHELDVMPNGYKIQQGLIQLTGQRTVPSVFVHGQHLGGNDDTQYAHHTGKLQELLLIGVESQ